MYMMQPKERRRNVTGIVYAEDAMKAVGYGQDEPHGVNWYEDLLAYMASLHVPCAVSPVHRDLYDLEDVQKWVERHVDATGQLSDEDKKKCPKVGDTHPEHAHIMLCYPGSKTRDQISEVMEGYCKIRETMWQRVEDADSLLRYFAHMDVDDPKKIKYDPSLVYTFGGLDRSALSKTDAVRKQEVTFDIYGKILENGYKHYSQLVRWAYGTKNYEVWSNVTGRAAFYAALFKGMSDERAEEIARKKREREAAKVYEEERKNKEK